MTPPITIDQPAAIAAAAVCWLSRWAGLGAGMVRPSHPSRCGWCDYPPAVLLAALESFDHDGWPAREFRGLPPSIRSRLVLEAQALEPEAVAAAAEPMTEAEPAPTDDEDLPVPDWVVAPPIEGATA